MCLVFFEIAPGVLSKGGAEIAPSLDEAVTLWASQDSGGRGIHQQPLLLCEAGCFFWGKRGKNMTDKIGPSHVGLDNIEHSEAPLHCVLPYYWG